MTCSTGLRCALLLGLLATSACRQDETVTAYGAADKLWHLRAIDDEPTGITATLRFLEPGQIAGDAPCNSYTAHMTTPYPWFEATEIVATKRACPDLGAEAEFFTALQAMSLSEVLGTTLILSTPEGHSMLFTSDG